MNNTRYNNFDEFFKKATDNAPYPYQRKLAEASAPEVINVATGAGKTEAAILGVWLWRRLNGNNNVPRRLFYCLPRRVLVEQTECRVKEWLKKLGLQNRIRVVVLMGGNNDHALEQHPAEEYIIIGTQDMLISGALNRAYGSSPYGWPRAFGLYNNDCMWIMDEIQIMENTLPTSRQLDAFRNLFGTFGPHHTVWMSATASTEWLKTVDSPHDPSHIVTFSDEDLTHAALKKRNESAKMLHKANISLEKEYGRNDISYLQKLHKTGTPTAIMVNTVKRAQDLYDAFKTTDVNCILIHSKFRAGDRTKLNEKISSLDKNQDIIIISTQVLESGVDISVRTLITELAPWSNMVQRFGRCNRRGELNHADVYWIDIPNVKKHLPYDDDEMTYSRSKLIEMTDKSISPANLPSYEEDRQFDTVLRKKDMLDLFDTAPDLSGNYIDASRFIRNMKQQLDVDVFWRRENEYSKPDGVVAKPDKKEICTVSISDLKEFLKKRSMYGKVWNYEEGLWKKVHQNDIFPGQTIMLDNKKGGYTSTRGWSKDYNKEVVVIETTQQDHDSYNTDIQSQSSNPVTLEHHTIHVLKEVENIASKLEFLDDSIKSALTTTAKYHDIGKVHDIFQDTMRRGMIDNVDERVIWAKSQKTKRHKRSGFRHEAASALAYLAQTNQPDSNMGNLIAYLIASHHGKVRLAMRNVSQKKQDDEYLLGLKTGAPGDILPKFSSSVVSVDSTTIDVSIAQIGRTSYGCQSWTERVLTLRSKYGPFQLAYLEMLVRAADALASKKERDGEYV